MSDTASDLYDFIVIQYLYAKIISEKGVKIKMQKQEL